MGRNELVEGIILVRADVQVTQIPKVISVCCQDTRWHGVWKEIMFPITGHTRARAVVGRAVKRYTFMLAQRCEPYKLQHVAVPLELAVAPWNAHGVIHKVYEEMLKSTDA